MTAEDHLPAEPLARLLSIMARLRDPNGGCPWDLEQTFATIAPYTIEEAFEVADAIDRFEAGEASAEDLKDELGDLLLQVVFHSQIAHDRGLFGFADVAQQVADKMLARHPHVFGTLDIADAEAMTRKWEDLKAAERQAKAAQEGREPSVLDGVALGLPALLRAAKLQKRAARVGFDWTDPADILDKVEEELGEVRGAMAVQDLDNLAEEIGDLLFVLANLARRHGLDPEACLRGANAKFIGRFQGMERLADQERRPLSERSLVEQEALWQQVKTAERKG